MHIVHILPELNQGGVERVVLELNRELVARGHRSTIISAGGTLSKQADTDGGTHITLDVCSKNPLSVPFRVRKLQTTLAQLHPDILHAHSRVPAWLAWFANKKLRIPFITSVHGFNSVSKYSEIMTRGDRVICVSHPVKDYIQQNYPVPATKIDVIHPGVNPVEFNPETTDLGWMDNFKTQYGLNGKFIVTTVGRITELKDYETFIQAVCSCAKSNPNIRGLIVGGVRHDKQAYFERLQELVRGLGMEKHIIFAGSHMHIAEIHALSDMLVSCSKKPESFGLTLIEALAMDTPVIATRHGGPLDIIREGENGFLFEPQRPEELAQKLSNKTRLQCTNLRADTLERFGLNRMIDATLEAYRKVTSGQQIKACECG
jgi:glycosyltransferase involved in cell wall biosynthesis